MDEQLLNYIKEYLIDEVNRTELTEQTCEDIDDGICYGRKRTSPNTYAKNRRLRRNTTSKWSIEEDE